MSMLFDVDTEYGHVVKRAGDGAVYEDDGTPVDFANPRPCLGCGAKCRSGGHDPCIANLPSTRNACCGHGRALTPVSNQPSGYVALQDGRTFRFVGTVGGDAIRAATAAALAGEPLPEGFVYDEDLPWWAGLTDAQKEYVESQTLRGLRDLVVLSGATPSAAFDAGQAPWWDGVTEEQKKFVWNNMRAKLDELAQEAKRLFPTE